jgi:hypothetical protein
MEKAMNLLDMAKTWAKTQEHKMIQMSGTLHYTDYHKKYDIPPHTAGIYFLFIDDKCVYIGETKVCIKARLRNHKRSIREPEWPVEKTGRVFKELGIQDEEFVVKYIHSGDLGLNSKAQITYAQDTFIMAYEPIGNFSKSGQTDERITESTSRVR